MAGMGSQELAAERRQETADRLHSATIRLLRGLRAQDRASGLSGPRLSALSVIVFAGPLPITRLAAAEQVRPPTMTRLVQGLERDGLVRRRQDSSDERVWRVAATARGRRLLMQGRRRRVIALAKRLDALGAADRRRIERGVGALERLAGSPMNGSPSGRDDGGR